MVVDDRIRVCYIIDDWTPGAGTENQLGLLLENLDRSRFVPHLVLLRPTGSRDDLNFEDCPILSLDVGSLLSLGAMRNALRLVKFLRSNRIHILQAFFFDSRVFGTLVARLAGVRRVVFCRREMGYWVTPAKLRVIRIMARLSHSCLVNAEAIRRLVARTEKFPPEKTRVIYNGVDKEPADGVNAPDRADLGLPDDAPVVGIVANIRPVKRHDLFLQMAEKVRNPECRFLVVGGGPGLAEFRARVVGSPVGERFHFHHTTSGIQHVMALFDVAVLTSQSEGLSNALVEYALAERPTVAFDVGGNGEVISAGETGYLVDFEDTQALADRVDSLLADPEKAQAMGQRAGQRARREFGIGRMVRETEDFYISILTGDGR